MTRGILLDISAAMAAEELRGPALYEALMALKPADLSECEWAEKAGPLLPDRTVRVRIEGVGDEPRQVTIEGLPAHREAQLA